MLKAMFGWAGSSSATAAAAAVAPTAEAPVENAPFLTPLQETCLGVFALMEYDFRSAKEKAFCANVVKGLKAQLPLDQLVDLTGLILRKRLLLNVPNANLFQKNTFAYHLTKEVVKELGYPLHPDPIIQKKVLSLVYKMVTDTDNFRKMRGGAKYYGSNAAAVKLVEALGYFPDGIISLFLPVYNVFLQQTAGEIGVDKTPKAQFLELFTKSFFFDPLVNVEFDPEKDAELFIEMHTQVNPQKLLPESIPNITMETKVSFGQNASWVELFPALLKRLEEGNKTYQPTKNDEVLRLMAVYQRLFQLRAEMIQAYSALKEIAEVFKLTKTQWNTVYQGLEDQILDDNKEIDEISGILPKLETLINQIIQIEEKNINEIETWLASFSDKFENVLGIIVQNPKGTNQLSYGAAVLRPFIARMHELIGVFTTIRNTLPEESPAQNFYTDNIKGLQEFLETAVNSLVYSSGTLGQELIKQQIAQYFQDLKRTLKPFRDDNLEGLTALHRLVKMNFSVKDEEQRKLVRARLKSQIACLIEEGFDLNATTTTYEQKSLFGTLRRRPALTVAKVAEQYGNSDILNEAIQMALQKTQPAPSLSASSSSSSVLSSASIEAIAAAGATATLSKAAAAAFDAAVRKSTETSSRKSEELSLFAKAEKAAAAAAEATASAAAAAAAAASPAPTPVNGTQESFVPTIGLHRSSSGSDVKGLKRHMRSANGTPSATPHATPGTTPTGTPRQSQEIPTGIRENGTDTAEPMLVEGQVGVISPLQRQPTVTRIVVKRPKAGKSPSPEYF